VSNDEEDGQYEADDNDERANCKTHVHNCQQTYTSSITIT